MIARERRRTQRPTGHHCRALRCNVPCGPAHLMCARHWRLVPLELKGKVYSTFGQRNRASIDRSWAPWWRAQARAVEAVAKLEGLELEALTRWVANELAFADTLEQREAV